MRQFSILAVPALLVTVLGLTDATLSAQSTRSQEDGSRWRFDVKAGRLRPMTMPDAVIPGRYRTFWYMVLSITNNTGKARRLALTARGETRVKTAPVARAGLHPEVTKAIAIKERIRKLDNILSAKGQLAQGEMRRFVVVFGNLSRRANHLDIRIAGLANSLFRMGKTYWRHNTELSCRFHRIGDEYEVTRHEIRVLRPRWVLVKRTKIRPKF